MYAVSIDYSNSNIYYGVSGYPYRTTNGGSSWDMLSNGIVGFAWATAPLVISPTNPATLYFATDHFHKSTNRGDSWTVLSSLPYDAVWIAVKPTDDRIVYVA